MANVGIVNHSFVRRVLKEHGMSGGRNFYCYLSDLVMSKLLKTILKVKSDSKRVRLYEIDLQA